MNATNRGVNRIVLLVVGIILLAAGGGAVLASLWSPAGTIWADGADAAIHAVQQADAQSRLSDTTTLSWVTLGILVALALIVVLAVVIIARLGGGASSTAIRAEAEGGALGAITIRNGFSSDAITHSLGAREEILTSKVSSRRVRGADVLHVSVTPRQNTSPKAVADTVSGLVDNLAALTGRSTPTLVSIHSGVRSRLAADQPRVR